MKPVDVNKVETSNWSPELENFGQIVENVEDIHQTIDIIIRTPRGTDPHRPTFASGIFNYIDHPTTSVNSFLIREATESITTWEPRIDVLDVKVFFPEDDLGQVRLQIKWRVKGSLLEELTIIDI